jgi:uncharacterized alpha-E superfamily protein
MKWFRICTKCATTCRPIPSASPAACAELQFGKIEDILAEGLHDTLTRFLADIYELGNRISRDFLVPLAA